MSKRLMTKLAVAIMALGAAALRQGCGEDADVAYMFVWAPANGTPNGGLIIYVGSW